MESDKELGLDEDLCTPERLAKGDLETARNMRGVVSRAIPANLTIIKELIRCGAFPYHYEIYGVGFLELRNAFRAPWAIRSSAVLMEQWGVGVSNSRANEIYEIVDRRVGKDKIRVVEYVIETKERRMPKPQGDLRVGDRRKNWFDTYRTSFDKLVVAMDEERERVFRELNGG